MMTTGESDMLDAIGSVACGARSCSDADISVYEQGQLEINALGRPQPVTVSQQ